MMRIHHIQTLATFIMLGGVGVWGHRTGWKAPKFSELWGSAAASVPQDWCSEHHVAESKCTICHPELQAQLKRIQFASADAVRKAGIKTATVEERSLKQFLTAGAEVDYDQTRVAQISARVSGRAWRVDKQVGERVTTGELLMLVDAAEVSRAKGEFLKAAVLVEAKTKAFDRIRALRAEKLDTQAQFEQTEVELKEARSRLFDARQVLINMGLPLDPSETPNEEAVYLLGLPKSLDIKTAGANLLPVTSPLAGVVISRDVVTGEAVDPGKTLFVVADVSRMWLNADVHLAEARKISLGQEVAFFAEGSTDESAATGKVSWMSTAVDSQTRTVKIRAELDNRDGRLLAKSFGSARITLREMPKAVAVPNEAIQWEDRGPLVFVRSGEDAFEIRTIRPGIKDGNFTEVLDGLKSGEAVATTGSYALKSDLLKSKLGPGCADD